MIGDRDIWYSLWYRLQNKAVEFQDTNDINQYKGSTSQHFLKGCQFILYSLIDDDNFEDIVKQLLSKVDGIDPNNMINPIHNDGQLDIDFDNHD